jgi:hypothetical protein
VFGRGGALGTVVRGEQSPVRTGFPPIPTIDRNPP